jgi:mono/diheme cytochrome c family protein
VLHQGESTEEVGIDQPADGDPGGHSPYGGTAGACGGGIVTPAITTIDPKGGIATVAAQSGVLSVDMAVSSDNNMLAVVQAGATDPSAPQRQTFFDEDGTSGISAPQAVPPRFGSSTSVADGTTTVLSFFDRRQPQQDCVFGLPFGVGGQSTAVAFRPRAAASEPTLVSMDSDWLVQSREPARLTLVTMRVPGSFSASVIDLGGESVRDTGHDLFHRDAGAGVACASCHAEGAEDGHVWNFTRLGLRRTQALHVGLEGTAPFHWAGDESDLNHLMSDVFVGRMGGVHQSDARVSALTRWLFALQPPAAPLTLDATAVERGQTLFQSPEVACSSCHSGDKLTNNRTVDVGTGEPLQVPSLRGIAYRAPYMHNGCALTLRDRFSPSCGGTAHGNIGDLQPRQIDDLVAYLRTL